MALKVAFETALFLILTLSLYLLFALALPILEGPDSLLFLMDPPSVSQGSFLKTLLFLSAGVCALTGSLILGWAPTFPPSVMGSLWAGTFFLIWVDLVLQLSRQAQTYRYLSAFILGLTFLYLFFFILEKVTPQVPGVGKEGRWKREIVPYWFLGWMGFYAGLSGLLLVRSFQWDGSQALLALGCLMVCFLNYLLYLHLRRDSGKGVETLSGIARWVFPLWTLAILAAWAWKRWIG